MIAFLKGYIEEKKPDAVLLDVQGVGYRVEISTQTHEQLQKAGSEVKLLIHHHITDSDQRLFGFFTSDEKALFEKLITVKGVGPKLGLTILSGLPAKELIRAITNSDAKALSRVPGIGKKTADRIILELKEKLQEYRTESDELTGGDDRGAVTDEVISALEALGFKKKESEKAVLKVLREEDTREVSKIIKKALVSLNR